MFDSDFKPGTIDEDNRGPDGLIVEHRFPEPDLDIVSIRYTTDIFGYSIDSISLYLRNKYGSISYRQLWRFCFDIAKAEKHKYLSNPFIGDEIPTIDMNWFDIEKLYLDGKRFKLRPDILLEVTKKYEEFGGFIRSCENGVKDLDISNLNIIHYNDVEMPVQNGCYCKLIKKRRLNKCILFGHEFELTDEQTFEELFSTLAILAPEVEKNTIYQAIWRNARNDHSRAFNDLSHKDTKYPFKSTELNDNYASNRYGVYSVSTSLFMAVIVEVVPAGRKILEDLEGHLEAIGKLFPEVREKLYNYEVITVEKFNHYWKLVSSFYTDMRATVDWMDRFDPYLKTKF